MVEKLKLITISYARCHKTRQSIFSPHFTTIVPGTLREIHDNDTTTRDKSYLNGLNMAKGEPGGEYMMLKTFMEVAQYYTVLNYGTPTPQKDLNPQDRTIVARPGMKPAPKFVLLGHSKYKVWNETPPDVLIMDNL